MNAGPGTVGYTITVRGEIGAQLIAALDDLSIESAGPETKLRLQSSDPERLRKTLDWLGDAGMTVVALKQIEA